MQYCLDYPGTTEIAQFPGGFRVKLLSKESVKKVLK